MQKEVVVRCRQLGKPVIVASHLLQSMIEYPTPTRAEVSKAACPACAFDRSRQHLRQHACDVPAGIQACSNAVHRTPSLSCC